MSTAASLDVVGAREALTLFGAISAAQLSHGYLFTGPAGVGKKSFARKLARSLLCEGDTETLLGYDDSCRACTLFRAGTHPDYFESEGVVKIGREAGSARQDEQITARDLVRELSLRGYAGKYRVLLLGDVEFATHEAANALLKFFEEPPEGVIVLLTTSTPGTLLPTIRSRFLEVPFSALSAAEVVRVLVAEGVEAETAQRAAAIAQGSITRARSVLEDEKTGVRAIAVAWFCESLGGRPYDLKLDERGATAAERRAFLSTLLQVVRSTARDWAVLALVGPDAALLGEDQRERLLRLPKPDARRALAVLAAAAEAERMAKTNVTPALVAEYLRMALIAL